MCHGVTALCKDVRADSRLVVQQRTFVGVGGRRVHTWTEVDKDPRLPFATFDDDRCGIGTETRGMYEIVGREDADLRGPLERSKCLIERQTDGVVVGYETRCLGGALKEVGKRVGAVLKGPDYAGCCGRGHLRIITERYFNC